jgi:hypothetical protein
VEFDPVGRLLILYRDNLKQSPKGNWHLLRLSAPISTESSREELSFSIPQEPTDPDPSRRWDSFASNLLLSPDGSHAYATFDGAVVTAKVGMPPMTDGLRNVNVSPFSSAISFDLTTFQILASTNTLPHTVSNAHRVDAEGDLLLLDATDTDWKIAVFDSSLHQTKTTLISMATVKMVYSCQFRPDFTIECPTYNGGGNLILSADSSIQLPQSKCKMELGMPPLGVGKDETLENGLINSDHFCTRSEAGEEQLVSPDLLPRCHQGWQAADISSDHRALLASCFEPGSFLDTFFYTSKAALQVLDATTLLPRATIPLSTRHRVAYAIYHHAGEAVVAVLEDGVELKVYNIPD